MKLTALIAGITGVVLLTVISCSPSDEELAPIRSAIGDKSTFFYQNPTEENFLEVTQLIEQNPAAVKMPDGYIEALMATWVFRAAETHGWPVKGEGRVFEIARQLTDPESTERRFLEDDSRISSTKLDLWWVSYFATGERDYLESILDFAIGEDPEGEILLDRGAAKWSFRSNCEQHPQVLVFARERYETSNDQVERDYLEPIVNPVPGEE